MALQRTARMVINANDNVLGAAWQVDSRINRYFAQLFVYESLHSKREKDQLGSTTCLFLGLWLPHKRLQQSRNPSDRGEKFELPFVVFLVRPPHCICYLVDAVLIQLLL